ncbi:MAG: AAA family ATPase [Desulfosarcinaceae bacterium]
MTADLMPSELSALALEPMPSTPVALLQPVCGRLLDDVGPLLAPMPLTALDILTLGDLLSLSGHTQDPDLILVVALLFGALNEGSVCLKLAPAHLSAVSHPDHVPALMHRLEGFLRKLASGEYAGLVDEADAQGGAPLIHAKGHGGAERPDLLYFQRFFRHEKRLQTHLERFLDQGVVPLCPPDRIDPLIKDLWRSQRVIRLGEGRIPLAADPWQQAALRLALMRPFAVISGGPGTGKTSLMVNMLRLLTVCGIQGGDIRLTAPTGRASQRMSEALQNYLTGIDAPTDQEKRLPEIEAATLHRLLRFDPRQQGFYYHAGHPLPVRAVIVDEVSMIDVGMLDRLLQAIDPQRTRLILLGDKDQLPSVQAGAVFAEMVPPIPATALPDAPESGGRLPHRFHDHLVILRNSYRAGRRLLGLGEAINAGRLPEMATCTAGQALKLPPDSCVRLTLRSTGGPEAGLDTVFAPWVDYHYGDHPYRDHPYRDHHYAAADDGSTYLELTAALSGLHRAELTAAEPPAALAALFSRLRQGSLAALPSSSPATIMAVSCSTVTSGWR